MDSSIIRHKLDLVVRLIDTTTGREVTEKNVRFQAGTDIVQPLPGGEGSYVFMDQGREDFDLQVEVYDYEKTLVPVRYEELDDAIPVKEVFLIPSENNRKGEKVLTFSGQIPGLQKVDAVALGQARCFIKEFDERKRIMTLFKKNSLTEENEHYGLIHTDGEQRSFEAFEVVKILSPLTVKISKPFEQPFSGNDPISRIVFGKVLPEGKFLLRVRDNASKLLYIVRYTLRDETRFEVVDFHRPEGGKEGGE